MTRVNRDAFMLQRLFSDGIPFFVVNAVTIVAIGMAMFAFSWQLALLVFVPVPAVVYLIKIFYPRVWNLYNRLFRRRSTLNAVVNDTLTGARVVKAFGKSDEEVLRFRPLNAGLYGAHLSANYMSATVFPMLHFVMQIGGFVVWAVGGWRVITGDLSFGVLMTVVGYVTMIYQPLRFMTMIVDWWADCMNSAQRIFEVIDTVPEVRQADNPVRLPSIRGHISVEHVTFAYETNRPVLHDVSFEIAAGEMIGLVGHTGAGKSTITNLITRLYDVDDGRITVDGVDVRGIAHEDLRSQIGIVLQDTYLFSGSIAENIAYGRPGADIREIVAAAQAAHAHEFIVRLADGYDTRLGRDGHDLSGGERQRIAIARAILHDPRILIFDEATSSVDTETERKIQDAIERLVKGRTTIAIAHRLSTLRSANRLVVVEKGQVVEQGTHSELVAADGVYAGLVRKQRAALNVIGVGE